jgi:tRNA modification GTPase
MERTIAAISTPPGPARRGVLRLSGDTAGEVVRALFDAESGTLDLTRRAALRGELDDGRGTQPCLLLWMPGPRSYTTEDVAELHLPGAPPLLAAALERVLAEGVELAQPGEFTRRAFLGGRIDLARAEGVLELVHATSERERRAATALLAGGLSDRVAAIRDGLDGLRALCEASLDFDSDETGHVPTAELIAGFDRAGAALEEALAWETAREPEDGRPRVVLTGAPNAGKSSLFNRLTGERAIVDPHAGTTRDTLRGTWVVTGAPVELADVAGEDPAATRGAAAGAQVLAERAREAADLVLHVVDATVSPAGETAAGALLVWNKVDLAGASPAPGGAVAVSARTGAGLEALAGAVAGRLGRSAEGGAGESGGPGRELSARHRAALERGAEALSAARAGLEAGAPLDLVAETLREATAALDEITGETSAEDVLDRIFTSFCLGK